MQALFHCSSNSCPSPTGARYTRAHPPSRLLGKFTCTNQSVASRMEAAIKKLPAAGKRELVGKTGPAARKILLG
jgi:predicted GIY-YIG superfamily endonuclease